MPFDYVLVKDITRNWLEWLTPPDTTITLTVYDGIYELDNDGGTLSEAFPNPFSGKTNLMYIIEMPQTVKAQLFSFNGQLISEFRGSLDAGTHMFTIEMDRPQMAFFAVTSGNNKCYKKVLNIGGGNNNKIEVDKISGHNQPRDVRVGDFVVGDLMEYEAVIYDNGNDISRVITQNQYGDEVISFTFDLHIPTVTTYAVGNISQTTGMSGGIVTSNGGAIVTERGICWSTSHNPTINDNHANNGSGNGDYIITMTNLVPGTTYYVRAYAINNVGIAYGNEVSFTTSQNNTAPTVTTNQVTDITQTTAISGGNVTSDGGAAVTARGVCWSTSHNPTTSDSHASSGTGNGSYTVNVTGLTANTTYYVRAYATNNVGTAYGNEMSFTTESEQIWPNGVLPGLFSVSSTQQVNFSQGNLQYQASTNTWRFADNQYDYIGNNNSNISSTYSGWIDLFGWGTSGYNHGAVCYQPWSTSLSNSDYYAYGDVTYNLYDQTGKADWGYNAISNGGSAENMWRTLTMNEWGYVLLSRNTNSGIRYAKAQVNGINGIILLPDNWNSSTYSLNNTNTIDASYTTNIINSTDWSSIEMAGAVFIPAAGFRYGLTVNVSSLGAYWSSGGYLTITIAPCLSFYDNNLVATDGDNRRNGLSVRLVSCESVDTPTVTTNNITNITQTTATGGGIVTSSGSTTVTARGICWSTNHNPTTSGNHTTNGTGTGSFTADISGLTANTTYYVRAYATNSVGTSYGSEVSFTTSQNVTAPIVTTSSITNITQTTATGGGNVTSDGGATVTSRGICWSTSHNPTISSNHTTNGSGTGSFTANITGLTANTTYYVRAYATNSVGTSYGSEVSFTTSQNVTAPIVTTSSITNITQTTATGGGNVTSDGGATVTARGICWSTSHNPTINGNHTTNGTGTGSFTANMTGLTANTTYYVRAYATNSVGTSYGNEVSFTTLQNATVPTVSTNYSVTNITSTTATCGGNVTSDGGATVTERGICWSTSHNPTNSNYHASNGTGTGSFTANMTGLNANTTYYVRAYATNSVGTSYGGEISFTTQSLSTYTISVSANPSFGGYVTGGGNYSYGQTCTVHAIPYDGYVFAYWTMNGVYAWDQADFTIIVYGNETLVAHFTGPTIPTGAINGLFSVSATKQVYFSRGNLQYQASTNTWRFANNQYDYVGEDNSNISSTYNGWIDLFGWGTSGNDHGAVCYQPYGISTTNSDYYAYGSASYNLNNQTGQADWGYNLGGNIVNLWRTMTAQEWIYVLNTRNTVSGIRYAKARVNNVNGVVLLPDNWSTSTYTLSNTNTGNANYDSNIISASQWITLQNAGAVFLPAAGERGGNSVGWVGSEGNYWSATHFDNYQSYSVSIGGNGFAPNQKRSRGYGQSVRLVINAQ